MTLIAGIDVGNSTTEIVIARTAVDGIDVVCNGTAPTAGSKGSATSLRRAAQLLERLERTHGVIAEVLAMARFRPVITDLVQLPLASSFGRRLASVVSRAQTPSGAGLAAGLFTPLADLPKRSDLPLVVSVPQEIDFTEAAARINAAVESGMTIVGILCEADEAVLVGNRLKRSVPVLDEVPLAQLASGEQVLLEVAAPGGHVQALADPVTLAHLTGLPPDAVTEAVDIAARNAEARVALVRRRDDEPGNAAGNAGCWVEYIADNRVRRLPLAVGFGEPTCDIAPGSVRALQLPSGRHGSRKRERPDTRVRDMFAPDLLRIVQRPIVRRGSIDVQVVPLSVMREGTPQLSSPERLSRLLGRRVVVEIDEPLAAFKGAMTTPGAPVDAVVCDIGAGTINVVDSGESVTAAGAGDLLTLSASIVLGIPVPLAERVKRYRSVKALTPHLIHDENGDQRFAASPVGGAVVGMLCAETPTSLLPFDARLAPEEWRALRLSLKMEVLGANLERGLRALQRRPTTLLLCGGGALDQELLRSVSDAIARSTAAVGRANVAGVLGPRYAVAYGLILAHALSSTDNP